MIDVQAERAIVVQDPEGGPKRVLRCFMPLAVSERPTSLAGWPMPRRRDALKPRKVLVLSHKRELEQSWLWKLAEMTVLGTKPTFSKAQTDFHSRT